MKKSLLALALCLPAAALAQAPAAKPAAAPAPAAAAAPAATPAPAAAAPAATPAPAAAPAAAAAPAPAPTPEEARAAAVKALEKAAMAERADLVAKNLPLTAEQAAAFWPVYKKYQDGFSELFQQQLDLLTKYASTYDKLDDAGAVALMNGQIDRDAKVAAYRAKWFPEFQKVLPGKLAAKFMQIDRRLSLVTQLQLAAQVPVIQ
jgi:hypothetical protein